MHPIRLLPALTLCAALAAPSAAAVRGATRAHAVPSAAGASCAAATRYRFPAHALPALSFAPADFAAISARTPDDMWAVGTDGTHERGFIAHWDGRAWATVPSALVPEHVPLVAAPAGVFYAVAASTARDAWAAGVQGARTIVEHWDGARWRLADTPLPYPSAPFGAASAGGDTWLVGSRPGYNPTPLIAMWDGRRWAAGGGAASATKAAARGELRAVAATSGADAWAVGGGQEALIEHWDGRAWTLAALPGAGKAAGLSAVVALSPADAWVGGSRGQGPAVGPGAGPLLAHWDGRAWRVVPAPAAWGPILALAAASPREVWGVAIGTRSNLLVRWDGRRWGQAATLGPDFTSYAIAAPAPGSIWVTGTATATLDGKQMMVPEIDHYRCTPSA